MKFTEPRIEKRLIRRSREGAWIEMQNNWRLSTATKSRSREGAWIEINLSAAVRAVLIVAPVRERGLK